MRNALLACTLILCTSFGFAQEIALLKYKGGGDWYANPTALPNLIAYANRHLPAKIAPGYATVEPHSREIFTYPFIHLTGHGNVVFNDSELQQLRVYLQGGGFLHIDDNYGMDEFIRREIKRLFPQNDLVELPMTHPIFQKPFSFPKGLPKIHEHEGKRPQAFGLFLDGRLALVYTYESDLSDGWEDEAVHNNPANVREKALQMGTNLLYFCFTQ